MFFMYSFNLLTRESQKCWQVEGIGFHHTATCNMAVVVHCTIGLIVFWKCVQLRFGGGSHWRANGGGRGQAELHQGLFSPQLPCWAAGG